MTHAELIAALTGWLKEARAPQANLEERDLPAFLADRLADALERATRSFTDGMEHPGPLVHKDACCLSLYFNRAASLSNDQHYRINEWLKKLIEFAPDHPNALASLTEQEGPTAEMAEAPPGGCGPFRQGRMMAGEVERLKGFVSRFDERAQSVLSGGSSQIMFVSQATRDAIRYVLDRLASLEAAVEVYRAMISDAPPVPGDPNASS